MIQVNIAEIIKSKNPGLYKRLPRFVIGWAKRLIREDRVNELLTLFGHQRGVPFITSTLDFLKIKRRSKGLDRLDPKGRYIFASNHPLGGVDGFSLAESIEGCFGSVRLVVNDILMYLSPVAELFVPINKHGRQNTDYARALHDTLQSDIPIVYFPAGLVSRRIKGKITDTPWHRKYVRMAIDSKRDIVPTFVDDQNSSFFYWFAWLRKKLGIKMNIEMVLLPGELFKKEGKGNIKIYYGEPITYERLVSDEKTAAEWSEYIRAAAYGLKEKNK